MEYNYKRKIRRRGKKASSLSSLTSQVKKRHLEGKLKEFMGLRQGSKRTKKNKVTKRNSVKRSRA